MSVQFVDESTVMLILVNMFHSNQERTTSPFYLVYGVTTTNIEIIYSSAHDCKMYSLSIEIGETCAAGVQKYNLKGVQRGRGKLAHKGGTLLTL